MNWLPWALGGWSLAAAIWWLIALWLVSRKRPSAAPVPRTSSITLTVFKSLPGGALPRERAALVQSIHSFLAQLSAADQLLLGLPAEDAALWREHVAAWQRAGGKRVEVCCLPTPRQRANPKIAWFEQLAPHARGELWLWSDADIVAPAGLLAQLKRAAADAGGAVTCPYCVCEANCAAALLDAAFVNAEFLPGALLLGRLGSVDFAFGAATIFRAADFRARVSWDQLGAALADDYVLGQQLRPVRLSGPLVATLALETKFSGALRHYYRWQKTIRWCRPGSYAALLAITPWLGWLALSLLQPVNAFAWLGLLGQWIIECACLAGLSFLVGCRCSAGAWAAMLLWPPVRALTWLAVWLPLPVRWRGAWEHWARPVA